MKGMRKLDSPKGRGRPKRHSKKLEHLYKVTKCRECSVDVIRMDFKKMMGGFTKVKIQYENNDAISPPARSRVRTRKGSEPEDVNIATRLRSNENGMVLIHRKAYNKHPVKSVANKDTENETKNTSNILKERNSQLSKKALEMLAKSRKTLNLNCAHPSPRRSSSKQYYLVFTEPKGIANVLRNTRCGVFEDLLLKINKTILPTNDWVVEFLPSQRNEQDVVYDRIAAELEGLMPSEKSPIKDYPKGSAEVDEHSKPPEDFPSIMDILNEEPMSVDPEKPILKSEEEPRTNNIQASDIEAMLTGSSDTDTTLTLRADSTNANQDIKVAAEESADSKKNEDEVIRNNNILRTDDQLNKDFKQGIDSEDTDMAIKNETLEANVLQDEEMDVDNTEKQSDISSKEKKVISVADSEIPSAVKTVKKEDVKDQNLEREETIAKQDSVMSNDSKVSAINEELATTNPKVDMKSKPIKENTKKHNNSEKSFQSIDSNPKKESKTIEFDNGIKLPKTEDINMETNGIDIEDDKGKSSKVEEVKKQKTVDSALDIKACKTIIAQEDLSSNIPEYYNSKLVTHISFKHLTVTKDSKSKTVTFHKSFDYDVEIEGKKVQLLGAPKSVNDIEDLKVLLQIVNETGLNSFNIVH